MNDHDYFMYHLNAQLLPEERILKLSSKTQDKKGVWSISFIVNADDYDAYLNANLKNKVETIVQQLMPYQHDAVISYEKTITSEDYISHLIHDYLYRCKPVLYTQVSNADIKVKMNINNVKIEMTLAPFLCDHMHNSGTSEKLTELLNSKIIEDVELEFVPDEKGDPDYSTYANTLPIIKTSHYSIKTSPYRISKHIISSVLHDPRIIGEVNNKEADMCSVAGVVSYFKQFMRKTVPLPFYVFKLNDGSAEIQVKYFPKSEKQADLFTKHVGDGCLLCVEGPIRWDTYSNLFALTLYRAAECILVQEESVQEEKIPEKKELPLSYVNIHPKPYEGDLQLDMFKIADSKSKRADEFAKQDFVVFDLETTGIKASECCIIEVGAAKIKSAKIVETFWSFIKPTHSIPPDVTKINSITNKDVEFAPWWGDVVADFYKFTFGTTLVAHNANFDMAFLRNQSEPLGFHFENPVIDSLALAQSKLALSNYKLNTVLEHFGLHNTKAHRALHDAISTAKMFILLSQM